MADEIFWWIGYVVATLSALAFIAFVLIWLWANFIHDRFGSILLRKTERRLSLASWYNARLMNDDYFMADDFPICERPFYLSYQVGQRRMFIMIGMLGPHRHAVIKGDHPEAARLTNERDGS